MSEFNRTIRNEIFDTTLRDAAQSLGVDNEFPVGSKVEMASEIAKLGTDTIEAGFPATKSDPRDIQDAEEINEVARTVGRTEYTITPKEFIDDVWVERPDKIWTPVITGLARANISEIENAYQAVEPAYRPGIHVFVASDEWHMRTKHTNKTKSEVIQMGVDSVRHARQVAGSDARIQFSLEAASTTDKSTLEKFVKTMLNEEIDVLNLPDTLGNASPIAIHKMYNRVAKWVIESGRHRDLILSTHNHNDGERAVANSIAAMHGVIDAAVELEVSPSTMQTETVVLHNGGSRNGNANIGPYVRNVFTDRSEFAAEIDLDVDPSRYVSVANYVARMANLELDPKAAVYGRKTIEEAAGIHSHGMESGGAAVYMSVDPTGFGHEFTGVHIDGKYQGRTGKANLGGMKEYRSDLFMLASEVGKIINDFQASVNEDELERITVRINSHARDQQRPVTENEIQKFLVEEISQRFNQKVSDFQF